MKSNKTKVVIIGLVLAIIISACVYAIIVLNKNNSSPNYGDRNIKLSVVSPSGAPSLAIASLVAHPKYELDYSVVDGGEVLASEFTNAEKDIIVAPINLGVKLIQNAKADYLLLGVVTWGNLYLVNDGTSDSKCASFGEGAIPGLVINSVKDKLGDLEIENFQSVQEAAKMLVSGKYHNAILAEPLITKISKTLADKGITLSISKNIQDVYKEVSGLDNYPQAAIFAKRSFLENNTEDLLNFTLEIKRQLELIQSDDEHLFNLSQHASFEEFGLPEVELLKEAYPKMNMKFEYAKDKLDEIKSTLQLFGLELNDSTYVK